MAFEENVIIEDIRLNPTRELNQFIPPPRGWILYSGISIIGLVAALALIISYLIQYPDVVDGRAYLRTKNPPIEHLSQTSNRIQHLFFKDGDSITTRSRIAILDSETSYKALDSIVQQIRILVGIKDVSQYKDASLDDNYQLGLLQDPYSQVIQSLDKLKFEINEILSSEKINILEQDINILLKVIQHHNQGMALYKNELRLTEKENKRKKYLENQGVVSASDLEKDSIGVLQQNRQFNSLKTESLRFESQVINLKKQKAEILDARRTKLFELENQLKSNLISFLTKVKEWRLNHELIAQSNGIIQFKEQLVPGMVLEAGAVYATIVPALEDNPLICYTTINTSGFGKVHIGQEAIIELSSYSAQEFGRIHSKVSNITRLPQKNKKDELQYRVDLEIGDSLKTDYHKSIPINQNLEASVKIITEKHRLIDRVFGKIRDILRFV